MLSSFRLPLLPLVTAAPAWPQALFYLDPARIRPGPPEDVAALIESIAPQGVRGRVVNLEGSHAKEVVARAGAYGKHQDYPRQRRGGRRQCAARALGLGVAGPLARRQARHQAALGQ
jgi:hypothetical protein